MTIETCMDDAKKKSQENMRYLRMRYVCLRSNELMKMTYTRKESFTAANIEYYHYGNSSLNRWISFDSMTASMIA